MPINREILGDWVDQGYFVREYDDHIVAVCYKDNGSKELAVFNQAEATPEALQDVCKRHHARLVEPARVANSEA
jgi:hypothetical protein